MTKPAKLPLELVDEQPRRVSQLKAGETGYIIFTDLRVNLRRECFVKAKAQLRKEYGLFNIEVRRDENGLHVAIPPDRKHMTYTPRKIGWLSRWGLLPVASVTAGAVRTHK